jgi:hypothetical protein
MLKMLVKQLLFGPVTILVCMFQIPTGTARYQLNRFLITWRVVVVADGNRDLYLLYLNDEGVSPLDCYSRYASRSASADVQWLQIFLPGPNVEVVGESSKHVGPRTI